MGISYGYLGYFNGYFIWIPGIFQWIFHMDTWDISMDISFLSHRYFNGYFILSPRIFYWIFIWMPGTFNRYFILRSRIFHCTFYIDTWHFHKYFIAKEIARKSERNQNIYIWIVYSMLGTTHTPLSLFGPLNCVIGDFYEPKIMENGWELSDLEYLPTKTQYTKYLQIANTRTSRFFRPFKRYNSRF